MQNTFLMWYTHVIKSNCKGGDVTNSYTPDKWTIIDYSQQYSDKDRYAVMAGWGGGFTTGASWKRSSPIIAVQDGGECWNVCTLSGSTYVLRKLSHGVTGMTAQLISQASLNVLTEEAVVELFTKFSKVEE